MKAVDLVGISVEATSGTPLILLREQDAPFRLLPIFVGETEAASIAIAVAGMTPPRPLTHDLLASFVEMFHGHVDAVAVTDVRDGSFIAEITITGPDGDRRFDTRPSDAIALAVRLGAPLFVSDDVMDEAAAREADIRDDGIDEEVSEFRAFLDEVDPASFRDGL